MGWGCDSKGRASLASSRPYYCKKKKKKKKRKEEERAPAYQV
jgi:hypothetical protein